MQICTDVDATSKQPRIESKWAIATRSAYVAYIIAREPIAYKHSFGSTSSRSQEARISCTESKKMTIGCLNIKVCLFFQTIKHEEMRCDRLLT